MVLYIRIALSSFIAQGLPQDNSKTVASPPPNPEFGQGPRPRPRAYSVQVFANG